MRLALGALVAGSSAGTPHVPWLPARHDAFAFTATALLRTVKPRFEASGQRLEPLGKQWRFHLRPDSNSL
ncbi:hypothetical protein DIPPA_01331 [Diplonema papillatum]|nr:hypothetical protein DIPPA_01331 [Diplonema papillatum]